MISTLTYYIFNELKVERKILLTFIVFGTIVSLIRSFFVFQISGDQCIQIDAAFRLLDGQGLKTIAFIKEISSDVSKAPVLHYLTWYPPTYSLLITVLLWLHIPLFFALKGIYLVTSIVGWSSWGILGAALLKSPIKIKGKNFYLNYALAALLPIFNTPTWISTPTDIFLWAGMPIIILFVLLGIEKNDVKFVVLSGLCIGLLYSLRYQAMFIMFSVSLIFVFGYKKDVKNWIKSIGILIISSLIFILPVTIYIKLAGKTGGIPVHHLPKSLDEFFQNTQIVLDSVHAVWLSFFFPLTLIQLLNTFPWFISALIGGSLLLGLPVYLLKLDKLSKQEQRLINLCLAISLTLTGLFLFLSLPSMLHQYSYISYPRMYTALGPSMLFAIYYLGNNKILKSRYHNYLMQLMAIVVFGIYFIYHLVVFPISFGFSEKMQVFGIEVDFETSKNKCLYRTLNTYPNEYHGEYWKAKVIPRSNTNLSMSLYQTSEFVKKEHEKNPNAIFFLQYYGWNWSIPNMTHKNIRPLPSSSYWEQAYALEPIDCYFILFYSDEEELGEFYKQNAFKVVDKIPSEGVIVLHRILK